MEVILHTFQDCRFRRDSSMENACHIPQIKKKFFQITFQLAFQGLQGQTPIFGQWLAMSSLSKYPVIANYVSDKRSYIQNI